MAKILQLRQGTTTQHNTFKGAVGEVTVDTDKKTVVVHDGTTVGGTVLAKVSEVPSLVPQATETVEGKAKIATTAIAQAGTNDTDFLTAKKLRDALNASGSAPVSACRAWVLYDSTVTPLVIRASFNIASVTYLGGNAESLITFINEMPSANFVAVGSCGGGENVVDGTAVNTNYGAPPTTKTCRVGLKDAGGGGNRKYVSVAFFA